MVDARRHGSPPPPPEQSFDGSVAPELYGRGMGGSDDSTRWLAAFIATAFVAGDDPAMCIELARTMRAFGDLVGLPQRLEQRDQDALGLVAQAGLGEDELIEGGGRGHADWDVAKVARQVPRFDVA